MKLKYSISLLLLPALCYVGNAQDTLSLGYGRLAAKAESSVAADAIGREQLQKTASFNPYNSLYGQLPGLFVMQWGEESWSNTPSLSIRGIGSMNGNSVITVIDGVPFRDLSSLNVSEIENITVLKDAASLALYGNRGADGIIVVTTRNGSGCGLKVDAYYNFGVSRNVLSQSSSGYEFNISADGGDRRLNYFANLNYTGYDGFSDAAEGSNDGQPKMHNLKLRTNLLSEITPGTTVKVGLLGRLNRADSPLSAAAPLTNLDRRLYSDLSIIQRLDAVSEGLKLTASLGYDNCSIISEYPESELGGEDLSYYESGFNLNAILEWKRAFGKHLATASYIYNLESDRLKGASNVGRFMDNILSVDYSYDGRYFVSAVANCSASAKLENGSKWNVYPALSAAWVASNESFLKGSGSVDLLKVRASYGVVGYDGRLTYDMDKQFNGAGGSYIFSGTTVLNSLAQGAIPATGILPETDHKADIGVELGLGNMFYAQIDLFRNHRTGIAVSSEETLSGVAGRQAPVVFTGETVNTGAELALGLHGLKGRFGWHIDGNVIYARNKIIEQEEGFTPYEWLRSTGRQIGAMQGYVPDGFYAIGDFNSEGKLYEGVVGSTLAGNLQPGDLKYKDLNEDGIIDADDMSYQKGTTFPTTYYGINLGFTYGSFGLEAIFQGAADFMIEPGVENICKSDYYANNCWTPEKTSGVRYPLLVEKNNAHNSAPSPVWWEPGDYLKLRTLYIHYDMKFKEMNMCLFLRGLNLFTLDGIEMEPEYVSTGGPQTRTYQIGVKCSF